MCEASPGNRQVGEPTHTVEGEDNGEEDPGEVGENGAEVEADGTSDRGEGERGIALGVVHETEEAGAEERAETHERVKAHGREGEQETEHKVHKAQDGERVFQQADVVGFGDETDGGGEQGDSTEKEGEIGAEETEAGVADGGFGGEDVVHLDGSGVFAGLVERNDLDLWIYAQVALRRQEFCREGGVAAEGDPLFLADVVMECFGGHLAFFDEGGDRLEVRRTTGFRVRLITNVELLDGHDDGCCWWGWGRARQIWLRQ